MKCSICNDSFLLHSTWYVITDLDDMTRKESPCRSCKEHINKCKEFLKINLIDDGYNKAVTTKDLWDTDAYWYENWSDNKKRRRRK